MAFYEKFNSGENNKKLETTKDFSFAQEVFLGDQVKQMKEDRLLEDDFIGKIDPAISIEKCKEDVVALKNIFHQKDKINEFKSELQGGEYSFKEYVKSSEYLEALFYNKLGGKDGWIPGALVWKTADYDDYVNGIDFIVETNNREFSLATDVTFSHSKALENKLSRIKHEIEKNRLPEVTFYESVEEDEKPIPHVIIAVEREKVVKALKLWADGHDHVLDNHPLKAKTMLELEAQLESFAAYAKALGRRNIAASYNDTLAQIQRLIVNHSETIDKYQTLIDDDSAYQIIISFCDDLKKQAQLIEKEKRS